MKTKEKPAPETEVDEAEEEMELGMTVGELRKALEGLSDSLVITIRDTNSGFMGGITSAGMETDEDGDEFVCVDVSDEEDDFEEDEEDEDEEDDEEDEDEASEESDEEE